MLTAVSAVAQGGVHFARAFCPFSADFVGDFSAIFRLSRP
jgi:hypothetical protein